MANHEIEPNAVKESDLKPNSNTYKQELAKREKLEPIAKGVAVDKKESLWTKVSKTIVKDDAKNVGEYLMFDVVIPALKNAISDLVTTGINMFLFGENRPSPNTKRYGDKSYVSYNNYYSKSRYSSGRSYQWEEDRYYGRDRTSQRRKFDQVVVPSRSEAEQILDALVGRTINYGMTSVADLYDLSGVPSVFTDNDWGWDDVHGARIERVREGYLIVMPEPHLLTE